MLTSEKFLYIKSKKQSKTNSGNKEIEDITKKIIYNSDLHIKTCDRKTY